METDISEQTDYQKVLESTINAARDQNADLSVDAWKLVAQAVSLQVAQKETDEYLNPMVLGGAVGAVVGAGVGACIGFGAGGAVGIYIGGGIGVLVGSAFGPSEKTLEGEMPNDVKDAISTIRAGKTYYGHE